jgi:hypothetical protein
MARTGSGRGPGLTGVWQGLYSYANGGSIGFVATLIEAGAAVSGSTHETAAQQGGSQAVLYALIDGARSGQRVFFVKTYDGSGGWQHSVHYDGTLNGDASEIEGRWTIPGAIAGRFLMVRSERLAEKAKRRVAELTPSR